MLKEENSEVQISPNPSSNSINIVGSKDELKNIQFSNLAGQILNNKINIIKKSVEHYSIDLSNLPSGFYLLQTKNGVYPVFKE